MKTVRTARFFADVRRLIVTDLASKNPYAADRYLQLIDQAIRATARFPLSKQEHPHLGQGVRKILIDPYVILHTASEAQLVVLRLLHSHQNITRDLLKRRQ